MVNVGPLTTELGSGVWSTAANFNGFRVLAALLHGTLVVGVSQTAALNRGRHLYSARRPSRWALAHILVLSFVVLGIFKLFTATGIADNSSPYACMLLIKWTIFWKCNFAMLNPCHAQL